MIRQKAARRLLLVLVLVPLQCRSQSVMQGDAPSPPIRRILILNEQNPTYPAIGLIDEAMRESLQGSKYRVQIYREYLESNMFPDAADQKLIRDYYIRKYRNHRPDVIVTVGSSPLTFVKNEEHQSFAGIPVVFCLPGLEANLEQDPQYTGVTMGIDAVGTLEAALRLLPKTTHVLVVGGVAPMDRQQLKDVREQLKPFEDKVEISYSSDLAVPELQEQLKRLPAGYIVLYTSISRDSAGRNFSSREVAPLIASASSAPVFS